MKPLVLEYRCKFFGTPIEIRSELLKKLLEAEKIFPKYRHSQYRFILSTAERNGLSFAWSIPRHKVLLTAKTDIFYPYKKISTFEFLDRVSEPFVRRTILYNLDEILH